MKIVINPSWKCQLQCPYCWLPHTKIRRKAREHTWVEWSDALRKHARPGSIIDLSGGEPLLFDGIVSLLSDIGSMGLRWAITTNALATKAVIELINVHPRNCVVVNVSDHSGNLAAHENIQRLKSVFPVVVHRCNHPGAGNHEKNAGTITYQKWAEGEALDGVKRICDSGINHVVIDPGGNVYRCCVDMQVGNLPIGNIFHDELEFLKHEKECAFGCSTCYRENPREWEINMRTA